MSDHERPRWKFQREEAAAALALNNRPRPVAIRGARQESLPSRRLPASKRDAVAVLAVAVGEMRRAIDDLCFPVDSDPFRIGYVYAIRAVIGGPIKIGRAIDPVARLADIQSMNPHRLELLGLAHFGSEEGHLHLKHGRRRLHGEWFDIKENPLPIVGDQCFACARGYAAEDRRALAATTEARP